MKKTIKTLLAAVLAFSTAACSSSGTAETGNTAAPEESATPIQATEQTVVEEDEVFEGMVEKVTVAITSASTDTGPFALPTPSRSQPKENMFATLWHLPRGGLIEDGSPYVAKSITKVDEKTYDVEIWEEIYDSKGNHITIDDVIWSYQKSFELSEFTAYSTDIESLEKKDDYHMTIHLLKSIPGSIEAVTGAGQLSIVSKAWYESATDDELHNDPACTGPYTLQKTVPGSEIICEVYEDFWLKKLIPEEELAPEQRANVKVVDYKVITEPAIRTIALQNHEVDYAPINANDLSKFYENGKSLEGWNVRLTPNQLYYTIFCNMDEKSTSPLAHDINLRKAALYALSSEDILFASGNTLDTAEVLHGLGTRDAIGYQEGWDDPDYDYMNYDVEKAKEFYAASGKKPGEVTLRVMSSISIYNDAVRSVAIANLEEAGFKVETLAYDQALCLIYRFDSSVWDMFFAYKGSGTHIVQGWDILFNPDGYDNGGVNFTHDDHLLELLNNCITDTTDENIWTFNEYIKDQAIMKGLYTNMQMAVAQDGILQIGAGNLGGACLTGSVYAKDYVPCESN